MTTTVTITSTNPNHENVKVERIYPAALIGDKVKDSDITILTDGESITEYVHSGVELRISETAK